MLPTVMPHRRDVVPLAARTTSTNPHDNHGGITVDTEAEGPETSRSEPDILSPRRSGVSGDTDKTPPTTGSFASTCGEKGLIRIFSKWALRDSNPRHPRCKRGEMPDRVD